MRLSSFDLNDLAALDALLSEQSVTRAARRHGLSQPGMSNALARLRKVFHDPLLVRTGSQMMLTSKAEALRAPIREALALLQQAVDQHLDFDPRTDELTFTICCSDYAVLLLIGPLAAVLEREAPQVNLEIVPRVPDPVALLREGTVDLVIEPTAVLPQAQLPCQPLFRDEWQCCVWSGNDRVGEKITVEDYLNLDHVEYSRLPTHPISLADMELDQAEIARRIAVTVEGFLFAPFVVQNTQLVAMVPRRAATHMVGSPDIRLLDPPFPMPTIVESQWWHPRSTKDAAHTWIREQIAAIGHDIAEATSGVSPSGRSHARSTRARSVR